MRATNSTMVADGPARLGPFFQMIGPPLHALLRIGAALLFIQHGVQKLFGWLGGMDGEGATAPLMSMMGVAGFLEVFGGLLLLIGFITRPVALLLFGQMIAAYVIAHLPQGGTPIENQGELALLYALVWAFLFGNGAGPLSVDRWMTRRGTVHEQMPPAADRERVGTREPPTRKRETATWRPRTSRRVP